MGITGLIPFLEKASRPINISEFSGCTVAVDAYCWLHKGAFSCAERLARGEKCDAYVYYCMKYINMLLSHNIKPILVFDGQHLPAKADTEKKRRESRELNRRRAAELLRQDKPNEARTFIRRCVDITHSMALELMHACRAHNVDCITAPYEADSELAYLNLSGIAHIVITEDSDLILFGCKKVIFKLDQNGVGLLVEQERLHVSMKVRPEGYSFEKFRRMCILSGCDYLPSLTGIGLTKACRFITRTSDPDIHRALTRMSSHLNMPQLAMTKEYRDNFVHAEAMFQHQPVFDPISRKVVPLTPIQPDTPPLKLPEPLPAGQAYQLALGNLDPFTLKVVDSWNPAERDSTSTRNVKTWGGIRKAAHPSIWSEDFMVTEPKFRSMKAQLPSSTAGKRSIQNPNPVQLSLSKSLDESEMEAILMDEEPLPPPKRLCVEGVSALENEKEGGDRISPDLSAVEKAEVKNKFLSRFNMKRKTIVDETCKVQSRYFNSNGSTKVGNGPEEFAGSSPTNMTAKEDERKLKDLSNIAMTDVSTRNKAESPKKVKSFAEGIENLYDKETSKSPVIQKSSPSKRSNSACAKKVASINSSFDNEKDYDSGVSSCPNSYELDTDLSQSSQVTCSDKTSTSFKWKQSFHDKFAYANGATMTTLQSSKTVNNSFQSPLSAAEKVCSPLVQTATVDDASDTNKIQKFASPPSGGRKANPFRMDKGLKSGIATSTPNFSLLRDPVPEHHRNQEIDEQISTLATTNSPEKKSPPTASPSSSQLSTGSSAKCRSIGLSKKTTPSTTSAKSSQRSLISMFMLQPKPKVQCK